MKLGVVILAAGQGTRMRSALPKVLHPLAGRSLLGHVIETAKRSGADRIAVVYGHGGEQVPNTFSDPDLGWVEQARQLGTGHAVLQAMHTMRSLDRVLVLYGDVPMIRVETLQSLSRAAGSSPLALLTVELADPSGYGRVVRGDDSGILRIVEQRDATPDELAIGEINTGILLAGRPELEGWLGRLSNDNAQGEYYLTDIVAMAVADRIAVKSAQPDDEFEVMGINDRIQLAAMERRFQQQQAHELMRQGVTLRDPARFDLRGSLTFGRDVEIDVNVLIAGDVSLGDNVRIGANSVIRDSRVAEGVRIFENCVIENAVIGEGGRIGPFSRLRPDTELARNVHVGNFVEIKKTRVDEGSKINHLSYLGDSQVGRKVNVGAGTITCNYDGANKFQTVIGDGAFIGSDTQLVAPVEVGAGATVGAGSTITDDVPPGALALSRVRQASISGWKRPVKKKPE